MTAINKVKSDAVFYNIRNAIVIKENLNSGTCAKVERIFSPLRQ